MQDSKLSIISSVRRAGYRRAEPRWRRPLPHYVFPCVLALASWVMAYSAFTPAPQAEPAGEYQVKALFLYNFAKFVDWPASSFATSQDAFTICVVGEDPFGSELDQVVRSKTINSRRLVVKRVSRAQDVRSCQIAFIGTMDERRARKTLAELNSASVLTVGAINGFTEWGGVVKFTLEENKVRFEINLEAAEHAQLRISSKLLSLAKVVIRRGKG